MDYLNDSESNYLYSEMDNIRSLYEKYVSEENGTLDSLHFIEHLAIEKNNLIAYLILGVTYFEGSEVKRDLDKSIEYFLKSKKYSSSLFYLGNIYFEKYLQDNDDLSVYLN